MSANRKGELPVPNAVELDDRARELVRVWAAGGKQHVSLAAGVWSDPLAWGIMLVDLARHVANAYGQRGAGQFEDVMKRIKEGFDAEWAHVTDTEFGGSVQNG